ncbi:fimbrial protein [Raoultella planticola]|uniref:fimbrial protein n=1 Tax=Raoultella planticola TaxID=575 RepID=UPI001186439A|nr:type 1 fimbrial protein [Raoultella planticola]
MIKLIIPTLMISTLPLAVIADTLTETGSFKISVKVEKPTCTLQSYSDSIDFGENLKETLPISRDLNFNFVNCVGVSNADVSFEGNNIDSRGYVKLMGTTTDGAASGVIIKLYHNDKVLNLNNTLTFSPVTNQKLSLKAKLEKEDNIGTRYIVAGYVKSNVDFTITYR